MQDTMKAIVMNGCGGPEVLERTTIPLDWPAGPHDVLVRLRAAGLNPADAFFRQLGPYVDDGAPCILGHDGAGIVEAVARDVTRFRPGDAVCFCNGGIGGHPGTYAEFATVPETRLTAKPPTVGFEQAAALPLVLITAWEALCERALVQPGERVAATVSSDEKADFVRTLGVDRPIRYPEEDFVEAVGTWSDGRGAQVAFDNVGEEVLQRTYRAMAAYGRVVTLMGIAADDADETACLANLTLHNLMMLTPMIRKLQDRLDAQARIVEHGMRLLAEGSLSVHVAEVFDWQDIGLAHERLDSGRTMGKLVVRISD